MPYERQLLRPPPRISILTGALVSCTYLIEVMQEMAALTGAIQTVAASDIGAPGPADLALYRDPFSGSLAGMLCCAQPLTAPVAGSLVNAIIASQRHVMLITVARDPGRLLRNPRVAARAAVIPVADTDAASRMPSPRELVAREGPGILRSLQAGAIAALLNGFTPPETVARATGAASP